MHLDPAKSETTEQDPETLLRLLDLELKQKRAQWQQAAARHRTSRMTTFFSLFLVITAGLIALYFVFSRVNAERSKSVDPVTQDR
jgi:hypothetical protein